MGGTTMGGAQVYSLYYAKDWPSVETSSLLMKSTESWDRVSIEGDGSQTSISAQGRIF